MQRPVDDQPVTEGRSLRMGDVRSTVPPAKRGTRFAPSLERSQQDRERRHRERAIAAWLRDLSR